MVLKPKWHWNQYLNQNNKTSTRELENKLSRKKCIMLTVMHFRYLYSNLIIQNLSYNYKYTLLYLKWCYFITCCTSYWLDCPDFSLKELWMPGVPTVITSCFQVNNLYLHLWIIFYLILWMWKCLGAVTLYNSLLIYILNVLND